LAIVPVLMFTTAAAQGQQCVATPPGLTAWWPADGSFTDAAGNNDATAQNGATFGDGMVYGGLDLTGADDHVVVPDSPDLNFGVGSFSIHAWVLLRSGGPTGYAPVICKRFENDWRRGWILQRTGSLGVWHFYMGSGGGPYESSNVFSDGPAALGEFVHLVVVVDRSASQLKLYVNGLPQGTPGNVRWLGSVDTTAPVRMGNAEYLGNPIGWDGVIDEMAVFDRALTWAEVDELYQAGALGMCRSWDVQIDIRPGTFPNPVNLRAHGVLPVAILSSPTFDALWADPATLDLAGATVAYGGHEEERAFAHPEDVNDDGLVDLVVHFRIQDLDPGQLTDGVAYLSGATFDGREFLASDEIELVPQSDRRNRHDDDRHDDDRDDDHDR